MFSTNISDSSTNVPWSYCIKADLYLFNNGQFFFLIKCQNSYISYINKRLEKNCWFENWIFKNFVLKIHRSQTDYILFKDRITIDFCMNCILYIDGYWMLVKTTKWAKTWKLHNTFITFKKYGMFLYTLIKTNIFLWKPSTKLSILIIFNEDC